MSTPTPFKPEAGVEELLPQIKHFLRIAKGHRGASSGELAAYKLAKQVKAISATMQDLDGTGKQGFLHLLNYAAWPDTRDQMLGALPR